MGFRRRIGFIVKSQFNDWVTRAEEPEKILNQAVEEMEEGLETARGKIGLLRRRVEEEEKLGEKLKDQGRYWQKKAQEYVTEGMESNAREAVRKRRIIDEEHRVIALKLSEDKLKLTDYEECFSELEGRVRAAKERRELLLKEISLGREPSGGTNLGTYDTYIRQADDPFSVFSKMEDRVGRESELSADSRDRKEAAAENESRLIDEEIEAIKKNLAKGGKK